MTSDERQRGMTGSAEIDDVDVRAIAEVFGDERSRAIIQALEQSDAAMTAKELASAVDIPLSTVYRRLDTINETPILRRTVTIAKDGPQATKYDVVAAEITFRFESDGLSADVTVDGPEDDP